MVWTEAEGIVGGRPRTGCPAGILVIVVGSAGQGDGGSLIAVDGWRCNNNPNTLQHTEIRTNPPGDYCLFTRTEVPHSGDKRDYSNI